MATHIYALSTQQEIRYKEVEGFDGSSGWVIHVGETKFEWNITSHPGHVSRNDKDLFFTDNELARMSLVSDSDVQNFIRTLPLERESDNQHATLNSWMKVAGLFKSENNSEFNTLEAQSIQKPSQFILLTILLNTSDKNVEFDVSEGVNDSFIPFSLTSTSRNGDTFTWNKNISPSYSTRNSGDLYVSETEIESLYTNGLTSISDNLSSFNSKEFNDLSVDIISRSTGEQFSSFRKSVVKNITPSIVSSLPDHCFSLISRGLLKRLPPSSLVNLSSSQAINFFLPRQLKGFKEIT